MESRQKHNNIDLRSIWTDYIWPFIGLPKHPGIGLILFTCFGSSLLVQLIWQGLSEDHLFFSKTSLIGYSFVTITRLLLLLMAFVIITEQFRIKEHHIWGRNPGLGAFFMSFLAGAPAMLMATSIHNLFIFMVLKMENPLPSQLYFYVTTESSFQGRTLTLIVTILLPIIVEELFFRGLLFSVIPDKWWLRIPLPALVSTLFATNRLEFCSFLIIGLFASIVRYFTGNVLCSCLMRGGIVCSSKLLERFISNLDPYSVQNAIDYSRTVLYTSIIARCVGIVMMLVLIKQLRYYQYLQKNEDIRCNTPEAQPIPIPLLAHFRLDFFIGIACVVLCWIWS